MVFCNRIEDIDHIFRYNVTILILIDGFLQYVSFRFFIFRFDCHNPYFNRWFSAIGLTKSEKSELKQVTILILIDGFLQCKKYLETEIPDSGHNPYFNRWFSAILVTVEEYLDWYRHNPYFNRWFSAIMIK